MHVECLNSERRSFSRHGLLIDLLYEVIAQFADQCRGRTLTIQQFKVSLVGFHSRDFDVATLDRMADQATLFAVHPNGRSFVAQRMPRRVG